MNFFEIQPVITETSLGMAGKSWFTFRVPLKKNKNLLKKEIQTRFKVDVLEVRSLVVKGKQKRSLKTRNINRASSWKKVMVKIKEGQKIDAFDVGGNK